MILSRRCEYAMRAALYLAAYHDGTPRPVRELSHALEIPHAFLAKAVRDLVRAGLLVGQSGSRGGLVLARPGHKTTLKDVVLAVDGPEIFEQCVLRLPGCDHLQPCPLHDAWVGIREQIHRMLSQATLDAVAEATRAGGFRLTSLTVASVTKQKRAADGED